MPHGLSETFLKDILEGRLAWLGEYERRDHTLNLEIRSNKIQVYYRGGRLMLVEYKRKDDSYSAKFDSKYVCSGFLKDPKLSKDATQGDRWVESIPLLKREMDCHFATKKRN